MPAPIKDKPARKGGQAPHEPTAETRKQVETFAGFGIPQADIGKLIGVHHETLRIHYRDELDSGVARANSQVAQSLFAKAMGNGPQSVAAAIFWMKCRAKWKEVVAHEHTGPDGEPISMKHHARVDAEITEMMTAAAEKIAPQAEPAEGEF